MRVKESVEEIYTKAGCLLGSLILLIVLILALGIVFGVFCFEGWIFLLLWNWLAVGYFSAPILGYWACVGIVFALNFIGRLIFGRTTVNSGD